MSMHDVVSETGVDVSPAELETIKASLKTLEYHSGPMLFWQPGDENFIFDGEPRFAGDVEGHDFHGNQYTGGGGTNQSPEIERITNHLKVIATKMDFPPEKLSVVPYTREFNVGGQGFREGGHFSPSTGEITLNANSVLGRSMADSETMLAHEVMHRDFHDVSQALELEAGPPSFVDTSDIKSADVIRDTLSEHGNQLRDEDGVSAYSRAYWKQVPGEPKIAPYNDSEHPFVDLNTGALYKNREDVLKEPYYQEVEDYDEKYMTAVNETLAEISANDLRRAFGHHPDGVSTFDPTPRWRELHTAFKETAKALRAKRSK